MRPPKRGNANDALPRGSSAAGCAELKALLKDSDPSARVRFRLLFIKFYALNTGGLTEEFKEALFEILFNGEVLVGCRSDFPSLLGQLSEIKRKQGDLCHALLFESKLVASSTTEVRRVGRARTASCAEPRLRGPGRG